MNKDKVYLKGYVIGRAVDTLGYQGLMVQLENLDVVEIDKNLVHKDINDPQKVTVPQFVADWYEENKDDFEYALWEWFNYDSDEGSRKNNKFYMWLNNCLNEPVETLVKMKLFGYSVEKEKKYIIKFKNVQKGSESFKFDKVTGKWYFGFNQESSTTRLYHTKEDLVNAGFAWMFSCPGFEIEEVEE